MNRIQSHHVFQAVLGLLVSTLLVGEAAGQTRTFTVSVAPASIAENGGTSTFTVAVNTAFATDQTFVLDYNDGTASTSGTLAGGDFRLASTSLTLRAGETSVRTTVFAIDDRFEDDDETILISAIHDGSVVGTQQTITIIDDDEPPLLAVSLSHTYLIEGVDDGLTLTLRYSNNTVFEPRGTVTITLSGTAKNKEDYEEAEALEFRYNSNDTEKTVFWALIDDMMDEGTEAIIIEVEQHDVANDVKTKLGTWTVKIGPRVVFSLLEESDRTLLENGDENEHSLLVLRSDGPVDEEQRVTLTFGGTATKGEDYRTVSTLSISVGGISVGRNLTPLDDDLVEGDETIEITAWHYGRDIGTETITIIDDESDGVTDRTPPAITGATVTGSTLVLTYDEALDGASIPAPVDFVVTAAGSSTTVQAVGVAGSAVTLTLATAVEANQAVTLAYTPGANPIQDAAGNDAALLSRQPVTNNTSAQTRQILVSNSDSSVSSNDNDSYAAQGFVTGSSSYGYTVSEVRIRFGLNQETVTTAVKIRQNNNGRPGALVATLTNPNRFANDSFNTFTAPPDTHLDPNTKYFFTINEGVADLGRIDYSVTTNNAESGLTGWSVDDDRLWRSSEGATSWNTSPASLIFEIRGTTVSPPPPPTGGGGGGTRGPSQTVPGAPTNLLADGGDEQVTLSWQAPEADGGLAITDYEVRINRRGSWISMGSTQTTHTVTGLVNGTVYVFQVRAVNGIGRSPASGPAEATPGVGALDFAHFANGADIVSDLVFVNVATHPIRPVLYFYDQEGHPMDPESVVDLTEDLEVTEDGGLSIRTAMEPLGELTVSTHGRGELVSGSVAVAAKGPIGGVLRFDLPDIGVAGVGASLPLTDALFPARRQAGGIRTAAALHNLGEEAITVSCRLMSGGMVLEAVEIDLEANGQEARYIEELFTATDTSDFVGSVRCTAPGLFTGIAVELDAGNRIFTTLPVVPVARAGGGGQETVLYFAHFANGSGTTSDLVFVNVSPRPSGPGPTPYHAAVSPSRPALYFYDQEGNLMDPESVVDLTGDLEVTGDGGLSIQTEMEPLGELTISTHGRGALVSGSVKVVSEGPIGGVLRYALPGIGVTGVGASPPVRDALFPVRQEGGLATAAAIRNLTGSDLVVTCRLMKDGAVLEETQIPLAANGQEARYIEEMFTFTGADVSDFVGSVRCTVPLGEGMFTGVAVEIDEGNRIFTTLPVVPVQRAADSQE